MLRNIRSFYRGFNTFEALLAALVGAFATFAAALGLEEMLMPLHLLQPSAAYLALPVGFCAVFIYVARHNAGMTRALMLKLLSSMLISLILIHVIM